MRSGTSASREKEEPIPSSPHANALVARLAGAERVSDCGGELLRCFEGGAVANAG